MAGVEVGPNDIVIHLINPYRCGDCEAEFFLRTAFLEHVAGHIASIKAEKPCHQIICVTRAMEHAPKGITVTRDILQINDQQMFELQDPFLDVSQLPSLKALEQAGILKLPQPKQTQTALPFFVSANGAFGGRVRGKRQISLLKQQQSKLWTSKVDVVPSRFRELSMELERDLEPIDITEGPDEDVQHASSHLSDPKVISALVQQALLNVEQDVKVEGGNTDVNAQEQMIIDENHLVINVKQEEEDQEKFIRGDKKLATLDNVSVFKKHQQRQHTCPVCHKAYERLAQLMFHMKHHDKKKFIQFGSNFYEVRIISSSNKKRQMVQEYYLSQLLSKGELGQLETDGTLVSNTQKSSKAEDLQDNADWGKRHITIDTPLKEYHLVQKSDKTVNSESTQVHERTGEEMPELTIEVENREGSFKETESLHISASVIDQPIKETSADPVDLKKVLYKCGHCKEVFFTRSVLSRHLIKHSTNKPFQCEKCLKSFSNKTDLFYHRRTHTRSVQCATCNTTFSKPLHLRTHLDKGCPNNPPDDRISVLEDMRCLCKVCDKVLKSKSNAIRHLRIHDFQERSRLKQRADIENFATVTNISQNVEDHYKPLENSVGFQCLLCGEEIRFKSYMVTHVRRHLNQRLFKCDQCRKSYFSRHVLRKHQHNHTKPYKCPICGKGFIRRYMMTKHFSKRHDLPDGMEDPMKDITELPDQKLIQCDICGKTMKQCLKKTMMYHIRLHKDVRPFKCDICPKSFSSENALKKHNLTHSKPYVCQVCEMGFSRRYLLTDHFKKSCIHQIEKRKIIAAEEGNVQNQSMSVSRTTQSDLDRETHENKKRNEGIVKRNKYSESNESGYYCEPCNKHFTVHDTYHRHLNTFSKPTACKYCCQIFKDKHIAVAHQRSCLGSMISERVNACVKRDNPIANGDWQERVKIMKDVDKTIQKVHEVGADLDGDTDRELTIPTNVAEKMEGKLSGTTLNRTVEALKKGKFCCPQCDRVFSTPRGLKIHASVHVRLFKCEICGIDFKSIKALRSHHSHTHRENDGGAHGERVSLVETECSETNDKPFKISDSKTDNLAPNQSEASFALLSLANMSTSLFICQDKEQAELPNPGSQAIAKMCKDSCFSLDHQTLIKESQAEPEMRLMHLGTRGRPYRCQLCRKRFTEQNSLDAHMILAH